jgi:preprotein translocase subunit YajC
MQDWMSMAGAGGLGLLQEGGDLPTSVPGIGPGPGATEGQGAGPGPATTQGQPGMFNPMFLLLLLVLVFMIVTTMMSSRREKRRVAEMLSGIKRGDRVQTLAGMIGTVHEVRDDAIVLRVDDTTGTKIQFAKSAVQHVLKSARTDSKTEGAESAE